MRADSRCADTGGVLTDVWPLFGLVLRTPRLELRLPSLEQLAALGELAAGGRARPGGDAVLRALDRPAAGSGAARSVLQYQWRQWGALTPRAVDAGVRGAGRRRARSACRGSARPTSRSPARCTPAPGSAAATTAAAIGTEMRAAVLHLAFAGLGADWAARRRLHRQCGLDRRVPQARLRRRRHRARRPGARTSAGPTSGSGSTGTGGRRTGNRAGADRGAGAVPGAARRASAPAPRPGHGA